MLRSSECSHRGGPCDDPSPHRAGDRRHELADRRQRRRRRVVRAQRRAERAGRMACGLALRSYRTPSLILGVAVGGSTTASAVAAWRGSDAAGRAAVGAGGVLVAWIAAQVAII